MSTKTLKQPMEAYFAPPTNVACKICTIHLERLCYRRAWWFRHFRETLAIGVRLFALVHRIRPTEYLARSPYCHNCLRFKKNALKTQSPMFNWLDSYVNPLFNQVRDSLLTPDELNHARQLARQAEERDFMPDVNNRAADSITE